MINRLTFFIVLFLVPLMLFSQGTTCQDADPFCTGNSKTFVAPVNAGNAQPGANYGCLYTQPNPSWFYLQIANPGTIEVQITTNPPRNVDFACWGPFSNPVSPCMATLTAGPLTPTHGYPGPSPYYPSGNMIDCSYSIYSSEFCYIPNGLSGQFYLLLITNPSNQSTGITVQQSGGTGTTTCNLLPYIQGDSVCEGETIHLAVNFTAPGATYAWTGPNGWTSNQQYPSIPNATASMTGVYSVVVTVNGIPNPAVPCNVYVGAYPTVSIAPANPQACAGNPFVLTANSTEPNMTYLWSDSSTTGSITVYPSSPTIYLVTGTSSAGCTGLDSVLVDVLSAPVITLSGNPLPVCGGSSTTLNAGGAFTYQWSHGLGAGNPKIITPSGSSTYTVTGTSANGCTASNSIFVQSVGPPVIISANPPSVCPGGSSVLTAMFGNSFVWSHGLGTNTTVTVTPATTTTYTVTATDVGGCSASTIRTIAVLPILPVSVNITALPSGPICNGTNVTFTATPTNGGTTPAYQWKKNGTNVGTNSTWSSPMLSNGDIITCIMTSNAQCTSGNPATSNAYTITIATTLPASVSITASPAGTICTGTTVTFTATPVNGGIPAYQWKNNGVPIGGATYPSFSSNTLANGNNITCTMTSSLSCATGNPATSLPITMSVVPIPNPTIDTLGPYCEAGAPVNLTAVNPGGIWSGSGITDSLLGTFDPTIVGQGTYTVYYVLSNGICENIGSRDIEVYPVVNASIVPAGPFCLSSSPLTLISVTGGGIWGGPGIIDSVLGIFDPAAAGPGNHLVWYKVLGICSDTGYRTIVVNNSGNATINPVGPLCTNGSPVTLTAGTVGGVWSGTGITDPVLGIFDPGLTGAPGIFPITYMISSGLCADTGYFSILVNQSPDPSINGAGPFCINDPPLNLSALFPGGTWSGPGITSAPVGTFDPAVAGTGTHIISYALTSGNCTDTGHTSIIVMNPPDATITAAGPFCSGHPPVTLTAASPGGTWSGTGISAGGTFNPATVGLGTHLFTYTVSLGTCTDVDNINITINQGVDATIDQAGPFCVTDGAYTMTAADPGGVWTGVGITSNSLGTFEPAVAGPGTHLVIYTVNNGLCSDTGYINVVVINIPNATINQSGPYCNNAHPVILSAVQPGGVWGGTGITSSTLGTFDPSLVSPGDFMISYDITVGGCSDQDTVLIHVNAAPDASVNPAGPFCLNSPATSLSALNPGGTWSGLGITNASLGTFNPSTAGTGTHLIKYIITGICNDTGTVNILVYTLPAVTLSLPAPDTLCNSINQVALSGGSPANGTWSGNNVNSGVFDPSAAPIGWNVITYSYTDANSCSNSALDSLYVLDCSGIADLSIEGSVIVYPNPCNDRLYIKSQPSLAGYTWLLTDLEGRLITAGTLTSPHVEINVSKLPPGMYFLRIAETDFAVKAIKN